MSIKLLPRLEEYVKWKEMSLVSGWHNDGSKVSTLEKKTLKIFHVPEDLDYGILRAYMQNVGRKSAKGTRRLSEEFGTSRDVIHHRIKTLGKSYRSCRSVPHKLTSQLAQHRVDIFCHQLIDNPMDDRFIRRIVTCDEK